MKTAWKRILSLVMVLCVLVSLAPVSVQAEDRSIENTVKVEGTRYYSMAYEVLDIINTERNDAGLNKLTMSSAMLNAAMLRSEELYLEQLECLELQIHITFLCVLLQSRAR